MSPRDLDAWPVIRARVLRVVMLGALMLVLALLALLPLSARAQSCSLLGTLTALAPDNGYRNTFTFSAWDCGAAHEVTDFMGVAYLGNCSATDTTLTFHGGFPEGQQWDYTYTRPPCSPEPPASSASAPAGAASAATGADVARVELLLAAGVGVLCWGMGYAGGFNR